MLCRKSYFNSEIPWSAPLEQPAQNADAFVFAACAFAAAENTSVLVECASCGVAKA
jgi:hypothetical protein